jgi:hypothetical protein
LKVIPSLPWGKGILQAGAMVQVVGRKVLGRGSPQSTLVELLSEVLEVHANLVEGRKFLARAIMKSSEIDKCIEFYLGT